MANTRKGIFYPTTDGDVISYYDNAVNVLTTLAAKYGVSPALLALLKTYNTTLAADKKKADADKQTAKGSVKTKNQSFAKAKVELLREFQRINNLANFDESDARGLGIRREKTTIARAIVKPIIAALTLLPDRVVLDWIKGQWDGVIIFASADGITFEQIGIDMRSPYEDTRPNKIPSQPEVRYYKIRYLKNDTPEGQYSDVSSVTVLI